ncbi:putative aminoacrylate hydrolase RutD [Anaerotignum neopropionicum]|uniref:Putative aminoacrylate hydrolase RutD n=1 Tax=Anaerotignum neopropionicum TaxID=36847 RepID=A0A136WES4_9FIRM|nr:alpha/beta hydrolase [Anaerotignum neopropionicum]KXL52859.1 putative aminoacrylate hydrolase RutD [Anaerotignum neopropionicum]
MITINSVKISSTRLAYKLFGNGKINIVIELGLGACMGEWLHIAERLSHSHTVLLYERAGTNFSEKSTKERTPFHIAQELHELLQSLPHEDKLILLAHSQGSLYAQQFVRLYPEELKGLILLDPLSARDNEFKKLLTPDEFKKSGVDKHSHLGLPKALAKLHLGFLLKTLMKNAPPFYYYEFEAETKEYILNSLAKANTYETAIAEYQLAHDEKNIPDLKKKGSFPDIPLILITHTPQLVEKEIMEFGGASKETAKKIEKIWQDIMKEYLAFSAKSQLIQAKKSCHFIHLTEPELLENALVEIENQ